MRRNRVLFLSTGNAARGQIAEGLLRSMSDGVVDVYSAAVTPREIHPMAIEVMREMNIDISSQWPKGVEPYLKMELDWVITLSKHAKEYDLEFPGARIEHWELSGPSSLEDFRAVRDDLARKIQEFMSGLAR